MNTSIAGALNNINFSWRAFTHRGEKMTKKQVVKVLEYGLSKGYKTTNELSDEEVDKVINNIAE